MQSSIWGTSGTDMTQWRYGEITEIINEARHLNVTRNTLFIEGYEDTR